MEPHPNLAVGMPDPTPNADVDICGAKHDDTGAVCTWNKNHLHQWHVAGNGLSIVAVWYNEEVEQQVPEEFDIPVIHYNSQFMLIVHALDAEFDNLQWGVTLDGGILMCMKPIGDDLGYLPPVAFWFTPVDESEYELQVAYQDANKDFADEVQKIIDTLPQTAGFEKKVIKGDE